MTLAVGNLAAISFIPRSDGKLLCVWNRRLFGWSLPGGLVQPGESEAQAQERELREETGLETGQRMSLYRGPTSLKVGRANLIHIYLVSAVGQPQAMEPGCPIEWLSREDYLNESPYAAFYEKLFAKIPRV